MIRNLVIIFGIVYTFIFSGCCGRSVEKVSVQDKTQALARQLGKGVVEDIDIYRIFSNNGATRLDLEQCFSDARAQQIGAVILAGAVISQGSKKDRDLCIQYLERLKSAADDFLRDRIDGILKKLTTKDIRISQ